MKTYGMWSVQMRGGRSLFLFKKQLIPRKCTGSFLLMQKTMCISVQVPEEEWDYQIFTVQNT